MTKPDRRRVVLVGAGYRVQNNFLPVLSCLSDQFEISGIHSRTPKRLSEVADKWNIPKFQDLATVDWSAVDVVVISVPTSENAGVLERLSSHSNNISIVIDTPVASTFQEQKITCQLLSRFRSVCVTEDYMNFPQFKLVRETVSSGLIGGLRTLVLYNIGYLYHGLALIRSFIGFRPVQRIQRHVLGSAGEVVCYSFDDNFSATVVGPYRRHTSGGLFLEGTNGIITEFPFDTYGLAERKQKYLLSDIRTDRRLCGFKISGENARVSIDLPALDQMRGMQFEDKSDLNLTRSCGLMDVFNSLTDLRNINHMYGVKNAIYDSFVSRCWSVDELPRGLFSSFEKRSLTRWVANEKTYLKRSSAAAAQLAPDQKIAAVRSDVVEAELERPHGEHLVLLNVKINGVAIADGEWFIFAAAWT